MRLGSLARWRLSGGVRVRRCTRHRMRLKLLRIEKFQFFHMQQQIWLSSTPASYSAYSDKPRTRTTRFKVADPKKVGA